jgi:hypothetical protein
MAAPDRPVPVAKALAAALRELGEGHPLAPIAKALEKR